MFRDGNRVVKADGKDQKVPATGYWDSTQCPYRGRPYGGGDLQEGGETNVHGNRYCFPACNTLTRVVKDMTEAEAVTFESLFRRIDPAPPGAHVLSGSWQIFKESRSEDNTTITYKCTSQGFSAETPLGEKFDAKFDGKSIR